MRNLELSIFTMLTLTGDEWPAYYNLERELPDGEFIKYSSNTGVWAERAVAGFLWAAAQLTGSWGVGFALQATGPRSTSTRRWPASAAGPTRSQVGY
jgi:hypothetical protein